MERADVVVIGAGIIGSAAARSLGARGVDTILLEQFEPGHTRGSSHGATRIFRLSYQQPEYVPMCLRAFDLWRALEDAAEEQLLVTTGGLDAGPGAPPCAEAMAVHGVPHEWVSAREAGERFPGISFDGLDPVLYQADGGVTLAGRAVAAQVRVAASLGVDVRHRSEALGLRSDGEDTGITIRVPDGEIRARAAILAAGPWNQMLLAEAEGFGGRFTGSSAPKMAPTLQQISYFEPREAGAAPALPTLIEWDPPGPVWYVVPRVGDAPGVKVGRHVPGRTIDPREGPFELDPALDAAHAAYAATRLPGLDPRSVVSETCLYTMTADEDFVIDRVGPLIVGGGCSGHAFKFGPLLGEILADLATGRAPAFSLERFALDRSALGMVPVDS